jgi:hypothetical protein
MRISLIEFLPNNADMRMILMAFIKFEIFFDVYVMCSVLLEDKTVYCPTNPALANSIFFWGVILPCFVVKLITINCCMSPQSVVF